MLKRRMVGWLPLAVENQSDIKSEQSPLEVEESAVQAQHVPAPVVDPSTATPTSAPPAKTVTQVPAIAETAEPDAKQNIQNARRRMAGWQPLAVTNTAFHAQLAEPEREPVAPNTSVDKPAELVHETQFAGTSATHMTQQDSARRRMDGWQPLHVAHPAPVSKPLAEQASSVIEESVAPVQETVPAAAVEVQVQTPSVVTAVPRDEPAAAQTSQKPRKKISRFGKVLITLGLVAVVAAGVVLLAQWVRNMEPVAEFIATYDGTPTYPDGVEAGIPGWVGWQHFFNFFIIVMVLRSGLFIRNQDRPEAYWTPKKKSFFSPSKKNTPAKVSIQQWVHQSFNVLWVVNGLFFYVMVFATGHWMRLIPTNWDIFPNIISAGIQYLSLDWPEGNSWMYYNALQITTYFLTVFIAGPLAVLTGLRMSTWWPQNATSMNKAFPLPVARKLHFGTMLYFVAFIIVHLFLVFTTGVLSNLNMIFTARDAGDWWGIVVFAGSVAITVGVAWLMKPMFISGVAEKTGTVSSR